MLSRSLQLNDSTMTKISSDSPDWPGNPFSVKIKDRFHIERELEQLLENNPSVIDWTADEV